MSAERSRARRSLGFSASWTPEPEPPKGNRPPSGGTYLGPFTDSPGHVNLGRFSRLDLWMEVNSQALSWAGVERLTFEDFYAAEFGRVFDSAYSFCGDRDAAGDAAQEAFERAFARWRRLSRNEWAGAWVTTTALNLLRRRFRNAARTLAEQPVTPSSEPTERIDLLRALRGLPLRQRQAATLFYVADLPVSVIAAAMGLSEGAVKSHLSRARKHLRASLGVRHV